MPTVDELKNLLEPFGNKSIIIKDYVKSQKHNWHEACYIPDASNTKNAYDVVSRFLTLHGDNIQGGLVFREFYQLKPVGSHAKSQMPLTKEYRLFVLDKKIISVNQYWEEGEYAHEKIPLVKFEDVIGNVESRFFTMDIAETENGEWVIIELGDGQVAEFMDKQNLENFYADLNRVG